MNRITAPAIVLLVLAAAFSCVPALREAPDLSGSGAALSRGEAERRYREAVELFATRRDEAVQRASSLLRESAGSLDNPVEAVLVLSEVLVWQVEHEPDPDAREDLATRAVHAGQWCLDGSPEDPRCSYRLAIAVGVQARERPGTGVDAMPLMIELLETARAAEPGLDHGGPDRVLALVYLRAPGWPAGPGDPDLGHEHAVAAVEIDPGHPQNHLVLGEALESVEMDNEAIEAYRTAIRLSRLQESGGTPDAGDWLLEAELALSRL